MQTDINYQTEIFANRLKKRWKHLWKWARRNEITCFRVYSRDIPEVPFTVDYYDGRLHMAEYARPHERSEVEHTEWREAMVRTAGNSLTVPAERIFVKYRQVQTRDSQYEKLGAGANVFEVREGGLRFLVNLADYIDTGLFLDHRTTRSMVRDLSEGMRFLNLYSYTGAFSVYAAAGGARVTTSVDMSNTYTDWARENLKQNGYIGPDHKFVTADVDRFLTEARARNEHFDLIVLDPPTFSNSKRMTGILDIQRDHPSLVNRCLDLLDSDGVLLFSTNFRRLRFDQEAIRSSRLSEITQQTIPEDFSGKTPHRCWLIHRTDHSRLGS